MRHIKLFLTLLEHPSNQMKYNGYHTKYTNMPKPVYGLFQM
ncbi:MAG: hypothetical protein ACK5Z2_20590 [Bacteroidota bacterium]